MVLQTNTITAVTNLHIKFVISCFGFQLYFIMMKTKTADTVTESYVMKSADWKVCIIALESSVAMVQSPC
jgi:hypothetical protein